MYRHQNTRQTNNINKSNTFFYKSVEMFKIFIEVPEENYIHLKRRTEIPHRELLPTFHHYYHHHHHHHIHGMEKK